MKKLDEQLKSRLVRGRFLLNIIPLVIARGYDIAGYNIERVNNLNGDVMGNKLKLDIEQPENINSNVFEIILGDITGPVYPGLNEFESRYGCELRRFDSCGICDYSRGIEFKYPYDLNYMLKELNNELKNHLK